MAIATSARYERGQHIIDPRTRRPATGVASVSVVGPDLTFADAYATALFVMGVDGLAWLAERHPDYGAFLITDGHCSYASSVFERHRTAHLDTI